MLAKVAEDLVVDSPAIRQELNIVFKEVLPPVLDEVRDGAFSHDLVNDFFTMGTKLLFVRQLDWHEVVG